MGAARAALRRPLLLLHAAFLALVLGSLWLLATQEEPATRRFHAVPQHLVHARRPSPLLSREVLALLRMGDRVVREELGEVYAEDLFAVDWSRLVARRDVLHLGAIQRACVAHAESVVSHAVGRRSRGGVQDSGLINRTTESERDREALLESLRRCPDVDVVLPSERRTLEQCEDAAAYAKYLRARIVPRWVLEVMLFDKARGRDVSYHELCPFTPMVFLDANWHGVRDHVSWPPAKPVYLVAAAEIQAVDRQLYRQADMILCKTAVCAARVTSWFEREGNPRMTKVLYHRFTSSDAVTNALVASGVESYDASWREATPEQRDVVKFVYIAGDRYNRFFKRRYGEQLKASSTVKIHTKALDSIKLGEVLAQTGYFLTLNYSEGNGHFLNHARAAGALILSPDTAPTNELVTPSSGVLHSLDPEAGLSLGLKDVPGLSALFASDKLCASVDEVVAKMELSERQRRARRARQQFFYDTAFFAMKMHELLDVLRPATATDSGEEPTSS